MGGAVEAEYERRMAAAQAEFARAQLWEGRFRWAALASAVLAVVVLDKGAGYAHEVALLVAVVVAGLAMLGMMLWSREREFRTARLAALYERALMRLRGEAVSAEVDGERLAPQGHLYARDLNVVGKDSLFERLATMRTAVGQRGLRRGLGRRRCRSWR
jgi:hypothetical protein